MVILDAKIETLLLMKLTQKLIDQLSKRKTNGNYRSLKLVEDLIDFSSNDYLGLSRNQELQRQLQKEITISPLGSTGSRLLTGNHPLAQATEEYLANLFQSEDALIVNSGYMANLSVLSAIPQRGDTIIYDELCHASIKDGMRLSHAKRISFLHNNLEDLEKRINKAEGDKYIIVESIYSMDGDECPLEELIILCNKHNARLIVDEAHATGLYGENGGGLCEIKGVESDVFCRIYTFGKAIGYHGAVIVGSADLKHYLINFSRPLIYTTAMPPESFKIIKYAFEYLKSHPELKIKIKETTDYYISEFDRIVKTKYKRTLSNHSIQTVLIKGNKKAHKAALSLQNAGFDVRPILSPTVKEGEERLRICLHTFNSKSEVTQLLNTLVKL